MQALAVMEKHLAQATWFTGPAYGVADIALFATVSGDLNPAHMDAVWANSGRFGRGLG